VTSAVAADLDHQLELAVRAALAGGDVIRSAEGAGSTQSKGTGDYVTEVDRRSEAAIARVLRAGTPDVPILAEEEGGTRGERYWVVDPLDGTANFVHGFPIVGVSVALVEGASPVAGVVHAPFLGETYAGRRGGGAELRMEPGAPKPLRVSSRGPDTAIVGTGFPFRNKSLVPRYLPVFGRCFERFEDLRRPGAAALDLAWVAAGVFDGFFELNLSPWDVAAGALLVREAGGVVTDWEGGDAWLESGNILAGSPNVHEALLEIAAAR
jgi:myo-inositol-1(or 4)-monophosphatase